MENLRWQNDEIARIKMLYVSFGMEFVFRQMSNKCPGPFPEENILYGMLHIYPKINSKNINAQTSEVLTW